MLLNVDECWRGKSKLTIETIFGEIENNFRRNKTTKRHFVLAQQSPLHTVHRELYIDAIVTESTLAKERRWGRRRNLAVKKTYLFVSNVIMLCPNAARHTRAWKDFVVVAELVYLKGFFSYFRRGKICSLRFSALRICFSTFASLGDSVLCSMFIFCIF